MTSQTARAITTMTREGYEHIADQFSRSRQHSWGDFSVFDSLVKDGAVILDIGCGNGRLFSYLSGKKISYTGIDSSPSFIALAQETYRPHSPAPQFVVGDILALDTISEIRGKNFDIITMIASFHHIPQRSQALEALKQIRHFLAPQGLLCMENWNLWRFEKSRKTVLGALQNRLQVSPLPWEQQYGISRFGLGLYDVVTEWQSGRARGFLYYHAYTIRALRSLLREAGYTDARSYYIRDGIRVHWWNGKNIMTIAN